MIMILVFNMCAHCLFDNIILNDYDCIHVLNTCLLLRVSNYESQLENTVRL